MTAGTTSATARASAWAALLTVGPRSMARRSRMGAPLTNRVVAVDRRAARSSPPRNHPTGRSDHHLEENDMPKYVLAYHGGRRAETPAEQAQVMDAWVAWFGGLGDAVVDGRQPHRRGQDRLVRRLDHRRRGRQPPQRLQPPDGHRPRRRGRPGQGLPDPERRRLGRGGRGPRHVVTRRSRGRRAARAGPPPPGHARSGDVPPALA